jgi:thiamine biosynthesis lipoprotein
MRTVERRWRAMGTDCHVVAVVADGADDVTGTAVALVERLEASWSRFRAGSDITRVNLASGRAVRVGADTLDAVEAALAARQRTGGRFDPTVLPALVAAGYDRSFERLDVPLAGAARIAGAAVVVDRDAGTVAVERGAGLDLGGIGKGLAADRVAHALLATDGVLGALANLGGDLCCLGRAPAPTPEAWGIAVQTMEGVAIALAEGAVATSSTAKRRWTTSDGVARHHVVDPATGRSAATAVASATVVAGRAADAEVAATVALLDGTVEHGTPTLLVHHDGRTSATPEMARFLR